MDEDLGDFFAKALTAEGIVAKNFGNRHNARSFEQWKFIEELHKPEFHEINSIIATKSYLKSAIDIPLSYSLTKDDLNDAVAAIKKVMMSIKNKQKIEKEMLCFGL